VVERGGCRTGGEVRQRQEGGQRFDGGRRAVVTRGN
jgi:hypothetical protein